MRSLILSLVICAAPALAELPDFYKRVDRVFWVVEDMDKALAGWRSLDYTNANPVSDVESSVEFRGRRTAIAYDWAALRLGDVTVDFIDAREGDNAFTEFKKKHHSGIMALVHRVPTVQALDAEIARLKAAGAGILQADTIPDDTSGLATRYVLFDTEPEGKYVLGLIYLTEEGERNLAPPPLSGNPRRVSQYAFAVRNLDTVSRYWMKLGLPEMSVTHPQLSDLKYKGQPGKFDSKLGWQRHGNVVYEWILPLQGPNSYDDHMAKHGEGLHHLGFDVPDFDAAAAEFESKGFPAIQSGRWGEKDKAGSGRFGYHDTHAIGGIDSELLWSYRQ